MPRFNMANNSARLDQYGTGPVKPYPYKDHLITIVLTCYVVPLIFHAMKHEKIRNDQIPWEFDPFRPPRKTPEWSDFVVMGILILTIMWTLCLSLFIGVIKRSPGLLKTYCVVQTIFIVVHGVRSIVSISKKESDEDKPTSPDSILWLYSTVFQVYFTLCVYSYNQELTERESARYRRTDLPLYVQQPGYAPYYAPAPQLVVDPAYNPSPAVGETTEL